MTPTVLDADKQEIAASRRPKNYYPALDGLRAVAALLVFFYHYASLPFGWAGVDIFFVLSGFLITGILYDSRHATHRFRNFYVRRTLRIFPLYYGVFVILLALAPVFHWQWLKGWYLWLIYLGNYNRFLYLNAFGSAKVMESFNGQLSHLHITLFIGHFWSLCVEEQFYLLWPLVVFSIRDRRCLIRLCAAVILVLPVLRWIAMMMLPPALLQAEFLYRVTFFRVDALLLGGLLALLLRGPEADWLVRHASTLLAVFLSLLGAAIVLSVWRPGLMPFRWTDTLGYTLFDLAAAVVLLAALQPSSLIYRILQLRPLRNLGQISYGFYVFHLIPFGPYTRIARQFRLPWISVPLVLALTVVLTSLSYRYFESPFLRLKDRFTS